MLRWRACCSDLSFTRGQHLFYRKVALKHGTYLDPIPSVAYFLYYNLGVPGRCPLSASVGKTPPFIFPFFVQNVVGVVSWGMLSPNDRPHPLRYRDVPVYISIIPKHTDVLCAITPLLQRRRQRVCLCTWTAKRRTGAIRLVINRKSEYGPRLKAFVILTVSTALHLSFSVRPARYACLRLLPAFPCFTLGAEDRNGPGRALCHYLLHPETCG